MTLRPILLALVGLALAGGSVLVSEVFLNPNNNTASATQALAPETITLIAAARDIPFGAEITSDMLKPVEWPAGSVPSEAFDNAYVLLGPDGTAPRRATQAFSANDLISSEKVSNFGASVTLTAALQDGYRAIAIKVSAETAVGGFVAPGDTVDIVLTQGRGNTLRTGTILQNISVLGIDQNADESNRNAQAARTITVAVTPYDGQVLALSMQAGILSLTLRNDAHGLMSPDEDLSQITLDDVWGISEALPAPVLVQQVAPAATVRIRRGVVEQDVVVE